MKKNFKKKVIFILGPTAIGKTEVGIEIAKSLKSEIISCDSRQFYKELKIGTAPPSKKQLNDVKHHFVHHISIHNDYSAGKFEKDAINKINEIHKKNDYVIIVGGSGLYVNAICQGFDNIPNISKEIRTELIEEFNSKGMKWLQKKVQEIEKENFQMIDLNNKQRLLRILEVYRQTGMNISKFQQNKTKKREFEIVKIGLNIDRDKLYQKINSRVNKMVKKGLFIEANSMMNFKEKNALNTVGYKEIYNAIENKLSFNATVEEIQKNSRRYAKRQLTWFRKDKDIHWFNPINKDDIMNFISKL